MKKPTKITLRRYQPTDVTTLIQIFYSAVHALDHNLYTTAQKRAWAPESMNLDAWSLRFAQKRPWCACLEDVCVGFIELDPDGHIDCTYIHPDAQGQGIASRLYQTLEQEARELGLQRLYVEASKAAKPIFQHWGFELCHTNEIHRAGEVLINYSMEKWLS